MSFKGNPVIVPIIFANKLSINEQLAITLLKIADKAGLVTPSYKIYCKESDSNIAKFATLKEIPAKVFCPYHDTEHDSDDYEIELVFYLTKEFRERYKKVATFV